MVPVDVKQQCRSSGAVTEEMSQIVFTVPVDVKQQCRSSGAVTEEMSQIVLTGPCDRGDVPNSPYGPCGR